MNLFRSRLRQAVLLAATVAATPVFSSELQALLQLARANPGVFAKELPELPKSFVIRFRPTSDPLFLSEYDPVNERLNVKHGISLGVEQVYERCTKAGTFAGQNAFGVRQTVQRLSCERLELIDSERTHVKFGTLDCTFVDSFQWSDQSRNAARCQELNERRISIPMSPAQYRRLMGQGLLYEVRFSLGDSQSQEVFAATSHVTRATFERPVQEHVTLLRAYGRFLSLSLLASDGSVLLASLDR